MLAVGAVRIIVAGQVSCQKYICLKNMKNGIHYSLTLQRKLESRIRKYMWMTVGGRQDRVEMDWIMRRLQF